MARGPFEVLARAALLVLLAMPVTAEEIRFTASVDNQKIGLDDTLQLTVTTAGTNPNQAINPVLPPLSDFDIVGNSQSSNIVFANGRFSASRSIIYELAPRKSGTLKIPPVTLQYEGKEYRTDPIEIEVVPGSAAGPAQKRKPNSFSPFFDPFEEQPGAAARFGPEAVRLIAELDRKQVFQGEQATLSLKILTQVSITNVELEDFPLLNGFFVEDLPVDRNPAGKRVLIEGKPYSEFVVLRKALFPGRPGRFTIGSATFAIQTDTTAGFFSGGQVVRRQSRPIAVEVLALPEAGRPDGFVGTVGSYTLRAALDRATVALGDVAALKVTLAGRGNLKTVSPPSLPPLDDFKVYEPKYTEKVSSASGFMEGEKTWEYVLGPKARGSSTIGAITLAFFDPATRTYKVAHSEPLALTVEGGASAAGSPPAADRSQLRQLRQDIAFVRLSDTGIRASSLRLSAGYLWLLLPLLANVLGLAIRRSHEGRRGDMASFLRARAYAEFRRSMKKARRLAHPTEAKQFHQALHDALCRYAAHKLTLSPQGLTLEGVLAHLEERRIDEALRAALQSVWNDAEFGLFAPAKPGVNAMQILLRETEHVIEELEARL